MGDIGEPQREEETTPRVEPVPSRDEPARTSPFEPRPEMPDYDPEPVPEYEPVTVPEREPVPA